MDGSPDGIGVKTYEAGEVYDLPRGLGLVFVREGWGTELEEVGPTKDKMVRPTGQTKRGRKAK